MLIDTCIVIDFLRRNPRARDFLQTLAAPPSLSVISVTEVLAGIKSADERRIFEELATSSRLLIVDLAVARMAGDYVRRFKASHSVDAVDALIAATAAHHSLPLATLNLKHFPMFPNLDRPY